MCYKMRTHTFSHGLWELERPLPTNRGCTGRLRTGSPLDAFGSHVCVSLLFKGILFGVVKEVNGKPPIYWGVPFCGGKTTDSSKHFRGPIPFLRNPQLGTALHQDSPGSRPFRDSSSRVCSFCWAEMPFSPSRSPHGLHTDHYPQERGPGLFFHHGDSRNWRHRTPGIFCWVPTPVLTRGDRNGWLRANPMASGSGVPGAGRALGPSAARRAVCGAVRRGGFLELP